MELVSKRWFYPYWKADKLDEWLADNEARGLRLDHVSYFGRYVFRTVRPKEVVYYATFADLKETGMMDVGFHIKKELKADEIKAGSAALYLQSIFRISKPLDESMRIELDIQRNSYLRHFATNHLLIWGFVLLLLCGVTFYILFSKNAAQGGQWSVLSFAAICLGFFLYHVVGRIALNKQHKKLRKQIST